MKIKTWLVRGDVHGDPFEFREFKKYSNPEEVGVIVLGDLGFNYYLSKTDARTKEKASSYGGWIYCVRGNHEQRPELVEGMEKVWDENVLGEVYMESKYPKIRYFIDGGEYIINGLSTIVIGGAYSVDKDYRLIKGYSWFEKEQLDKKEMLQIENIIKGKHFDLVLTHTCPRSWQPTDLFLNMIDQTKVDSTMEDWLESLLGGRLNWTYGNWLFGHYHRNRKINDKAIMLFDNYYNLIDLLTKEVEGLEIK